MWWILTGLVYHHTKSNFLRAESGWYLFLSHSSPIVQHSFEKVLLTKSFKGHYAPIAFLGEFATAKLVGTNALFWKWRQITVLAVVALMLFQFVRIAGHAIELDNRKITLSAVGLTAILIFQPLMRDFVAWPFMILQLFWLLFSTIALTSLIQSIRLPEESSWPWLAAGAAYASLHFLGLGIATVAATAAGMAGLRWAFPRSNEPGRSKIIVPLFVLLAVTVVHAIVMVMCIRVEGVSGSAGWPTLSFLMACVGFLSNFAFATAHTLFSTTQQIPEGWQTPQDWPYGLGILLTFGLVLGCAFLRCRRDPSRQNQTRFILVSFASVAFLATIALIAMREWRQPSPHGFAGYLVGPRYLIPGTFALAGLIAELLFLGATASLRFNVLLNVALVVCAVAGNLEFARKVYPKVMPLATISHGEAWRSVVTMARECRGAGLPIPNVPLGTLTQEFFDWDLKLFAPLLCADLNLPPETNLDIVPWTAFSSESPDQYRQQVPSLAEVRKQLQLEPKK